MWSWDALAILEVIVVGLKHKTPRSVVKVRTDNVWNHENLKSRKQQTCIYTVKVNITTSCKQTRIFLTCVKITVVVPPTRSWLTRFSTDVIHISGEMFKSPANLKLVQGRREETLLMNEGRSLVKLSYIIRGVGSAHQPSSVSSAVTGGRKQHACLFKCLQTVHLPLALHFHPACLLWAGDHHFPLAEGICPNAHPVLDRGTDCLSLTMRAATVVSQRLEVGIHSAAGAWLSGRQTIRGSIILSAWWSIFRDKEKPPGEGLIKVSASPASWFMEKHPKMCFILEFVLWGSEVPPCCLSLNDATG